MGAPATIQQVPAVSGPLPDPVRPELGLLTDAVIEVTSTMFGIELKREGPPRRFDPDGLTYGVSVGLLKEDSCWDIALFGSTEGAETLVANVFDFEDGEEVEGSEVMDFFGELMNMAYGVVKRTYRNGEQMRIGVPIHFMGDESHGYAPFSLPLLAQTLGSDDFEGQLVIVWSEHTPASLTDEVASILASCGSDPQQLARAMAWVDEIREYLAPDDAVSVGYSVVSEVLAGVISESIHATDVALEWIRLAVEDLGRAIEDGVGSDYEPPGVPHFAGERAQRPIDRDEETLEILADFLPEADEALSEADATLMRIEANGATAADVGALFRSFHSIKSIGGFIEAVDVVAVAHATETMLSHCRDGQVRMEGATLDATFDSTATMRAQFAKIGDAIDAGLTFPVMDGRDELIARVENAIRECHIDPDAAPVVTAPEPKRESESAPKAHARVRVRVDLIERLSATSAMLSQAGDNLLAGVEDENAKRLREAIAEIGEIAGLLQTVPVGGLFQVMTRMVRDLSKKTGKLIQVTAGGEDTSLGRMTLEKLGDPLIHMIRNAVDHGIELPDVRKAAGKPPMGQIRLSAEYVGGQSSSHAMLTLQDDGAGMDPAKLVAHGVAKGVLDEGAVLSDAEAFMLIFRPGFSTATQVTAISGRGVGMDVVRKNIESLGGSITIESEVGKGTTFRITTPWRA